MQANTPNCCFLNSHVHPTKLILFKHTAGKSERRAFEIYLWETRKSIITFHKPAIHSCLDCGNLQGEEGVDEY